MKEEKEKKGRDFSRILIITTAVLFVLLLCSCALFLFTYFELNNTRKMYESSAGGSVLDSADEQDIRVENIRLTKQLLAAEQSRSGLESRISELEKKLAESKDTSEADASDLVSVISSLRDELSQKKSEIEALKKDLRMSADNPLDLNDVGDAVSALADAVMSPPQEVVRKTNVLRQEAGVPVVDASGEAVYDEVVSPPRIAVCYSDLTRGYRLALGQDEQYSSGQMDMLLLSYQLVTSCIAEQNRMALSTNDVAADSGEAAAEYDFDELIPCEPSSVTDDLHRNGSGLYSVSELIGIMLRYGDESAYAALCDRFGEARTKSAASSFGFTVSGSGISFTASQAERFAEAVYDLTEGENELSQMMKNAMCDSISSALTGYAVSPKKVAHMCLRGSCYGDIAFVYDENPYVIVILSDVTPGDAENGYLSSLAELADGLHESLGK